VWGQGPLPRAPSAPPRGPLPLDDSPRGGAARQPPRRGGGRMPYWAPAPLLARRARLAGPPRTRGSTPGSRGRVHHTATARTPLPRRGGAPTIRGRHRWRGPGQHPGATLGSPAASCPGPPATLGRARPPWLWAAGTAIPLEGGIVTVRHMALTLRDPCSPELCPANAYFNLFRWRPTCDHLVAHQPQPQPQYFPGIRNSLERAPT